MGHQSNFRCLCLMITDPIDQQRSQRKKSKHSRSNRWQTERERGDAVFLYYSLLSSIQTKQKEDDSKLIK